MDQREIQSSDSHYSRGTRTQVTVIDDRHFYNNKSLPPTGYISPDLFKIDLVRTFPQTKKDLRCVNVTVVSECKLSLPTILFLK
jgi:hypothetical protein